MTLPRGHVAALRPESAYPTLRTTEGGIPPGTPEAAAAIARVREQQAKKVTPKPLVVRRDWR